MRQIAIVGAWPVGQVAPFEDPAWEIWTVGRMAGMLPRITRLYELHEPSVYQRWEKQMGESEAAVYLRDDLPLDGWGKAFGLLNNSIAIMLAHSLEESVDVVALYRAPHRQEHQVYRESILYWIGLLRGSGIIFSDMCELVHDWIDIYGEVADED